MAFGFVGQDAGEVGADQQAGDRGGATEELVAHRDEADIGPPEAVDEGGQDPGAVLAGQDADGRAAAGHHRDGPGGTGRPVALGRRTVHPREEAALHAGRRRGPTTELQLEGAGHPDAVLVHREALVGVRLGEGPAGQEVVLVSGEDQATPEHAEEGGLPALDALDDRFGLGRAVGPHGRLVVEAGDAEGHHAQAGQLGVAVEHPAERVVEHRTVVDAGTARPPGRAPPRRGRAAPAASAGWWRRGGCGASPSGCRGRSRGCSRATATGARSPRARGRPR